MGSTFDIGSVSGSGNNIGDHGRVENHIQDASQNARKGSVEELLSLMGTLTAQIEANAAAIPAAEALTGEVVLARAEIEAGPTGRRLPSVRAVVAGIGTAAAGVAAVTETVDHILKLIGVMEADL